MSLSKPTCVPEVAEKLTLIFLNDLFFYLNKKLLVKNLSNVIPVFQVQPVNCHDQLLAVAETPTIVFLKYLLNTLAATIGLVGPPDPWSHQ